MLCFAIVLAWPEFALGAEFVKMLSTWPTFLTEHAFAQHVSSKTCTRATMLESIIANTVEVSPIFASSYKV